MWLVVIIMRLIFFTSSWFLLGDTQVLMLHKAFANGWSGNIRFSNIQLYKMVKLGGPFFRFLGKPAFGGLYCSWIYYWLQEWTRTNGKT